jgi:adenosylhomocysteine nucleosidase
MVSGAWLCASWRKEQELKARIAIVAAMARELRPLVRNWKLEINENGVVVYSSAEAVAAYAGIGADRVRLAVEAALSLGPVSQIVSAGWAGGLHPGIKGGMVRQVKKVIDAMSGEVYLLGPTHQVEQTNGLSGTVLLTMDRFASAAEKRHLWERYKADIVDMEAAIVAEMAQSKGTSCAAIKAISDDDTFDLPGIERYSTPEGKFREGEFAAYVALRPALWKATARMGRTSTLAARALCRELQRYIAGMNPQTLSPSGERPHEPDVNAAQAKA